MSWGLPNVRYEPIAAFSAFWSLRAKTPSPLPHGWLFIAVRHFHVDVRTANIQEVADAGGATEPIITHYATKSITPVAPAAPDVPDGGMTGGDFGGYYQADAVVGKDAVRTTAHISVAAVMRNIPLVLT